MQPKNCQSVVVVKSASTVCVAETICQPNQSNGNSQSDFAAGKGHLFLNARIPLAMANGKKIQFAQCVGQESFRNSEKKFGAEIFASRITGLPNFQMHKPRRSPNASA